MQILLCNGALGTCCSDPGLVVTMNAFRKIAELIQIIVPILLIIAACIQLSKMMINPEEKSGLKKIKNMFMAAVIVFFIPVFANVVLGMLPGNNSLTSCWEASSRLAESAGTTMPSYLDPNESSKQKSGVVTDPSEYQKGKEKPKEAGTGGGTSSSSSSSSSSNSSTSSTTSSTSSTSTTGKISGADVVAYAKQFIGKPYKRGGSWNGELPYTPTDCVGFVHGVYKHFGINIPSNTSSIYKNTKKFTVVTGQPVKAGDIVIYSHHRALITGNKNQVVHAMGEAYGIGTSKNYKSCGGGDLIAVIRVNDVY